MKNIKLFLLSFVLLLAACSSTNQNYFIPSASPYKQVQSFVVIKQAERDSLISETQGTRYTHVTSMMLVADTLPYKYKYFVQQLNVAHPYTLSLWCNYELSDTIGLVMCKTCNGTMNCMVGKNNFFIPSYCFWE